MPWLPVHHQLLEILALIPTLIQSALASGAEKTRDLKEEEPGDETGWNLGTRAVLQWWRLDSPLLQQQNTKTLYGTKNNCVPVQWGQVLDNRYQKTERPNCHFWQSMQQKQAVACQRGGLSLHSPPPVQLRSVAQTLCNPMGCSTPGLPVHQQLPEFTQTHVRWVSDAIQPFHLLSSSSPAFNLSQHQSFPMSQFFESGGQRIGVSASASVLPMNIQDWFPIGWITTTRGVDKPPKQPLSPDHWTQPYPHPIKGTSLAPSPLPLLQKQASKGTYLFSLPGAPVKPCLNFF